MIGSVFLWFFHSEQRQEEDKNPIASRMRETYKTSRLVIRERASCGTQSSRLTSKRSCLRDVIPANTWGSSWLISLLSKRLKNTRHKKRKENKKRTRQSNSTLEYIQMQMHWRHIIIVVGVVVVWEGVCETWVGVSVCLYNISSS